MPNNLDGERPLRSRLSDGIIIGAAAGAVIICSILLLSVFLNNKQQETLDAIRQATEASQLASEALAGSLACDLAAPAKQVEQPDGSISTIRPEGFINANCLVALGFDAVDVDGNGKIDTGGG